MAKVKIFKAIILDRKIFKAGAEVDLTQEQISRLKPLGIFDDPEKASKEKAKAAQDEADAKAKASNQAPVQPTQAQANPQGNQTGNK